MDIAKTGLVCGLAMVLASGAPAQQIQSEQYQLDGVLVTILPHDFLSEEELMTLRLVGQNRDALSIFLPQGDGFAALAVAPNEGFVRAGQPVDSAHIMAGLPDVSAARAAALAECNGARSGGPACEIVLEVAPR